MKSSKKKSNFRLKTYQQTQSQRQAKVAQAIHTSLVECLRKCAKLDPRLLAAGIISITKVNISADLRICNCFFVPFNTNLSSDELLEALNISKYAIRDFVTKQINLKFSPEIRFFYDEMWERQNYLDSIL